MLHYAIQNGIIDLSYVQEQTIMNKKKEILDKHGSSIWYNQKEQMWYCHIPDPVKGRVKRKRKNRADIEDVLFNAYANLDVNSPKSKTFQELFYEFMEYKKTQVGMGTIKRMLSDWNKFYLPNKEFLSKSINSITKVDIDMLLNQIVDMYKPKDKAFRNLCGIIKQVFEYAVDVEYLDKSPYRVKVNKKNIQHTRKKPNEKEVYTAEERQMLLNEMERKLQCNPSNTIPLAIMLDFEIGARVGELLALREGDIKDNKLHISRQRIKTFKQSDDCVIKESGWITVEYTKSDCGDRIIPLTEKALLYIKRIIDTNMQYGLINEDYLFVSPKDNKIFTEDALSAQLKRSCQKLGMPVRRPHKIRKTYASVLYQNGVPVTIISKLLGHAEESTTLKHYVFNVNNDQETENIVLNALQNSSDFNVTKRDQQIIPFPEHKKVGNLNKIKASQH